MCRPAFNTQTARERSITVIQMFEKTKYQTAKKKSAANGRQVDHSSFLQQQVLNRLSVETEIEPWQNATSLKTNDLTDFRAASWGEEEEEEG